jgi:deazaflavin-dependent oxidoreductase (nitroreductase family)
MTVAEETSSRDAGAAGGAQAASGGGSAGGTSAGGDSGAGPQPLVWGEGLGYPDWIRPWLPAMHAGFLAANRYVSVPALKMGLGRYVSNPATGYLMILRTHGRKSGEMRDAPLGYTIVGERVYCVAGFGRPTHWFQNVLADPRVEVILPGRAFSGLAEEVTDPQERSRVLVPLLRSMGLVAGMMGMGNPWRDSPDDIARKCQGMPLVRIHATGIAAGPEDPGGRYWVVAAIGGALLGLWLVRARGRRRR